MTGNCCRVTVDSIENCLPEEDFPISFRNMSLSDGLSTFVVSVGKYRLVSHADTILKKNTITALSFHYEFVSYMELDKQISLISFAWEVKY